MWVKDFWEWLFTSRAYRLLLDQNKRLQNEVDTLRADKERLLREFSPTLRTTLRNEPRVLKVEATTTTEQAEVKPPMSLRKPAHPSWRAAKAQLEHLANSREIRKQRVIEAHAGMK